MANLPQDPFTVLPEMFAAVRRDENAFKITVVQAGIKNNTAIEYQKKKISKC